VQFSSAYSLNRLEYTEDDEQEKCLLNMGVAKRNQAVISITGTPSSWIIESIC